MRRRCVILQHVTKCTLPFPFGGFFRRLLLFIISCYHAAEIQDGYAPAQLYCGYDTWCIVYIVCSIAGTGVCKIQMAFQKNGAGFYCFTHSFWNFLGGEKAVSEGGVD